MSGGAAACTCGPTKPPFDWSCPSHGQEATDEWTTLREKRCVFCLIAVGGSKALAARIDAEVRDGVTAARAEAWDEGACDCGDWDGHPGDCAIWSRVNPYREAKP